MSADVLKTRRSIEGLGLHTVCESARCPNLSECYQSGNATFLILGDQCTRNCSFCAVSHQQPQQPDPLEGRKIVQYMEAMNIRYAVITSVTRDDLEDGGVSHYVRVVRDIRNALPAVKLELLVPDFDGRPDLIAKIVELPIEVFAHNVETVPALYGSVRQRADYGRSLAVLSQVSRQKQGLLVKSGLMVGLGETEEELKEVFADLAACGIDILTIGQYLRPGRTNLPVQRFYTPEEFERLKVLAQEADIRTVASGPYVRSSYLAENNYKNSLGKNV
jgi:lipoic acid synthetase